MLTCTFRTFAHSSAATWREGGQAQFIDRQVPEPDDYSTAATREWALRRLDEELTV